MSIRCCLREYCGMSYLWNLLTTIGFVLECSKRWFFRITCVFQYLFVLSPFLFYVGKFEYLPYATSNALKKESWSGPPCGGILGCLCAVNTMLLSESSIYCAMVLMLSLDWNGHAAFETPPSSCALVYTTDMFLQQLSRGISSIAGMSRPNRLPTKIPCPSCWCMPQPDSGNKLSLCSHSSVSRNEQHLHVNLRCWRSCPIASLEMPSYGGWQSFLQAS